MKSWLNYHYNFEYNQFDLLLNNYSSHKIQLNSEFTQELAYKE